MEKKERYHKCTYSNTTHISCYHCKNEWEVEGVLDKYKCTKCGRWGKGNPQL